MTVQDLSERLEVSKPTIRRDLTELAAQNKIIRSHGGAMRVNERGDIALPVDFRRSVNAKEKAAIAKVAAGFIHNESVIFVDASTTVFLCDKSKFGKNAAFNLVSLDEVDYMVTNGEVPESYPPVHKEILYVKNLSL